MGLAFVVIGRWMQLTLMEPPTSAETNDGPAVIILSPELVANATALHVDELFHRCFFIYCAFLTPPQHVVVRRLNAL